MITLNELYELMSVFIEIAHEKENNVSSVCMDCIWPAVDMGMGRGRRGKFPQKHLFPLIMTPLIAAGPGKGDGGDVQAGGQEQGRCAGAG